MGCAPGERQRDGRSLVVYPGDPPAVLRLFFVAAFDAVYPYLSRRCAGDWATAEDLTQETFVAALRALRKGAVDHLSVGWLMTVAQSRLIDHYRRETRLSRHLRSIAEPDQTESVEAAVLAEGSVVELLGNLPASQRLDVVLHHLDGLRAREIAERTSRTERAVEASLARARRTMRAHVNEERA